MELGVTTDIGGAVACPVCTLYLREGISLQRHLDTHPKEQVIEALIKASGSSSSLSSLQLPQTQVPQVPQTLQPSPPQQQVNAQSSTSTPTAAAVAAAHIPTQAPFPIGPVFECPPINAMMPPQFASFNYQQFVNNGTMMIPQYAMAPPQANQMMQMLYNPYSMYQQQQVPTVQMISPVSALPTTRIRPVVTVANAETNRNVIISTSTNEHKQIIPEIISEPNMERILPDMESCETSTQQSIDNTTDIRHDNNCNDNDNNNISVRQLDHRDQQTQSNSPRPVINNSEIVRNDTVSVVCESSASEEDKSESILPDMEEPEPDIDTDVQCRNEQQQQQQHHNQDRHQRFSSTYNSQADNENSNTDTRLNHLTEDQDKLESQESLSSEKLKSSESIELEANSAPTPIIIDTCQQNEEEHLEHLFITMIESGFVETHEKTNDDESIQESNLKINKTAKQNEEQMEEESENHLTPEDIKYINNTEACVETDKCIDTSIIDECDFDYAYRYKHSLSAPASPVSASKKISHSYSTRSECGSNENLNFYPAGFDASTLQVDVDDEDEDEEDDDDEEEDDDDDEEEEEEEEEEESKHVGDNFDEEDMEIEEIASPHTPFAKQNDDLDNVRSHTPLSAISGISGLRVRRDLSKPSSPISMR
ncbi:myb-like protein AA, partial [Cotesia glomerata]